MGKIFYSNCLFEAVKAKIKNWQTTEIKHIRSKDNLIHFIWIDKKNGYRYDFAQVETVKYWVQLLWFKGYIRKKKLK